MTPATPTHADPRAVGMVLLSGFSVQFGATIAARLFARAGVPGVALMRLGFAALVLMAVGRPALRGRSRADWRLVLAFGAVLAGMNTFFYYSIRTIPLGLAVTLEVFGPLTLAVWSGRRAAAWLWAGLAMTGVVVLGQNGAGRLNPAGVAFAVAAGAMWAAYIVLSRRVGGRFARTDGLALSMSVAALMVLPLGLLDGGTRLLDPVAVGLGVAVAALSSVVPYSLELGALRRLPTSTFAVLMSLGPAISSLAGWVALGQALDGTDVLAIALVIAASAGAVWTAGSPPRRRPLVTTPATVPGA